MNFVCPHCGAPAPSADALCSGAFTDVDHPANVAPVPTSITLPTAPPPLDRPHSEFEWTPQTVIQARSIVRRMLEDWPYQPPAVIASEQAAFRRWLTDTNPPPSTYVAAAEAEAEHG